MERNTPVSRRRLLQLSGAVLSSALLSACGKESNPQIIGTETTLLTPTPGPNEMCAINGLESLESSDPDCIIEPQSNEE